MDAAVTHSPIDSVGLRPLRWAVVSVLGLGALAIVNDVIGALVFTHPAVSGTLTASEILAPFVLLGLGAAAVPWRWLRWACGVMLALAVVVVMVVSPLLLLVGRTSQERIAVRPVGRSRLVLVRTNCGATCSFGLRLIQEWPLAPGVVRQREVAHWYPASEATLEPLGLDSVRVTVAPYGRAGEPRTQVLALQR